jgi:uncharacterized membrane protein
MSNHIKISYHVRWHLLLVHLPISLFGVAFLFQVLHLIFSPACFTLSTTVVILLGMIAMIPTTTSGWSTWKSRYKGARTFLFQRKIGTAYFMLAISILLTIWRFTYYDIFTDEPNIPHWIFMAGTLLLIIGAVVEGYYGGKLHHRD